MCLGLTDLVLPYYYDGGVFEHFLLLSWAGRPLLERVGQVSEAPVIAAISGLRKPAPTAGSPWRRGTTKYHVRWEPYDCGFRKGKTRRSPTSRLDRPEQPRSKAEAQLVAEARRWPLCYRATVGRGERLEVFW